MANVFQTGITDQLDYFSSIEFCDHLDIEFYALHNRLRLELGEDLAETSLPGLIAAYRTAVLHCVGDPANLPAYIKSILTNTLANLINIRVLHCFRKKSCLNESESIRRWHLGADILSGASEFVETLQKAGKISENGLSVFDYDLKSDAKLLDWVRSEYQPILRDYVGEAMMPVAHVRIAKATENDSFWVPRYEHEYANFHWDSTPYSFPLIIYLGDVEGSDGPFSYVDSSDKLQQDYILRAMHMGVHNFTIDDGGVIDKERISKLPKLLRSGERVGFFTGEKPFNEHKVERVTGPCGTAALFDGFHLVHDGGFPEPGGSRLSLFLNYRFPRQRLYRYVGNLAERYMRGYL